MIASVQEGVQKYQESLGLYKAWQAKIRFNYGEGFDFAVNLARLDETDYQEAVAWRHRHDGYQAALGLSEEEDKAIRAEAGL
ncbi:hypothetical protein KW786_03465 [Candidatus Parcubacteria bacterium]|nr:hypothetical protein [Candidatus Parcubacteria bacterium]